MQTNAMSTKLFQVHAPNKFTAGFCVDGTDTVWETAPILRWMKDKPLAFIQSYCKHKGWELNQVNSAGAD